MNDIISIRDFSRQSIDEVMARSLEIKSGSQVKDSPGLAGVLFFEPSTRTRTSSELALRRLGMSAIGFAGPEATSVKKGEPLADTLRMYQGYGCNIIVMRHSLEGAARFAAITMDVPVVNAGDGSNGHPTQTFLDLTTILERYGRIDGLRITLVGDLKYGRTVHSLLQALSLYDVEVKSVSPSNLNIPGWHAAEYRQRSEGRDVKNITLEEAIESSEVLYLTRIQRERFPDGREGDIEYDQVSGKYTLGKISLSGGRKNLSVMHPLPRYKHRLELSMDVDETEHALYFAQAQNGLYVRTALFERIMSGGFPDIQGESTASGAYARFLPSNEQAGCKKPRFYIFDNGTFIDHLEPGVGYKLRPLLGMMDYHDSPLIAVNNIPSQKYGLKDVYGIADRFLGPEDLWKVALVSDRATINIIREGVVHNKFHVSLPARLESIVGCTNTNCISYEDNDEHVTARFYVEKQKPDQLRLRCLYCEKPAGRGEFEIIG